MSTNNQITACVYAAREQFQAVLSVPTMRFDREAEFAIQALSNNASLAKTALNNQESLFDAVTNVAAIGVSLNPAKKQAYLVPRKSKVCLDISYMGLMDMAVESGSVLWAQADLVRESDLFELNGVDKPPTHKFHPFSKERGPIIGAYVVVKTNAGDYLTDCMSREEIDSVMNRSESVKAGGSSPWKTDYGEMAKKTVVKRAYKYWPKTERLSQAIHHLNTEVGEGLVAANDAAMPAAPVEASPELIQQANDAAMRGMAAYRAFWEGVTKEMRQSLLAGHEARKKAAKTADDPNIIDVEPKEAGNASE